MQPETSLPAGLMRRSAGRQVSPAARDPALRPSRERAGAQGLYGGGSPGGEARAGAPRRPRGARRSQLDRSPGEDAGAGGQAWRTATRAARLSFQWDVTRLAFRLHAARVAASRHGGRVARQPWKLRCRKEAWRSWRSPRPPSRALAPGGLNLVLRLEAPPGAVTSSAWWRRTRAKRTSARAPRR